MDPNHSRVDPDLRVRAGRDRLRRRGHLPICRRRICLRDVVGVRDPDARAGSEGGEADRGGQILLAGFGECSGDGHDSHRVRASLDHGFHRDSGGGRLPARALRLLSDADHHSGPTPRLERVVGKTGRHCWR